MNKVPNVRSGAASGFGDERFNVADDTDAPEPYDPEDHTVPEVKDHVAEHPEETAAILAAEQEGKDRSTLVSALEADTPPRSP